MKRNKVLPYVGLRTKLELTIESTTTVDTNEVCRKIIVQNNAKREVNNPVLLSLAITIVAEPIDFV